MNQRNNEILSGVAADTLEQLAFLFSFPGDGRSETDLDSALAARVLFTGPFSGALLIIVSDPVLSELTSNMLGVDSEQETTADQKDDALKETINVICGNLLPAVAGKESVFDMDAPKIIRDPEEIKAAVEKYNGEPPTSTAMLDIDGELCGLYLFGDARQIDRSLE